MDDLPKRLAEQLDLLQRTLLAMETYLAQVRSIVADTRKLLDEVKYGPPGPGGDRFNVN
jgi:hypothetical protein